MVDEKIINDVKDFISQLRDEIDIKYVYLFGSYAKEKNIDSSDIDIAIVSDNFEGFIFADNEKILKRTKNVNRMIEPHPFRVKDFTQENPFVKEIISTGIQIF